MQEDRRFYVYLHRQLNDHRVFYVGKGSSKRAQSRRKRNKKWLEIVEEFDFYYEIYAENLTEDEAFEIETYLISINPENWYLVNSLQNSKQKVIPDFRDILFYDETSPTCLRWKHHEYKYGKMEYGTPAGWLDNKGRYCVTVFKSNYKVHRVVMTLFGYDVSGKVVNHIDCNPLNNRIDNLELVTQSQNAKRTSQQLNIKLNSRNTSGINGVRETVYTSGNKAAHVFWMENSKLRNKLFSYSKYGEEEAWRLAIEYRKSKTEAMLKE